MRGRAKTAEGGGGGGGGGGGEQISLVPGHVLPSLYSGWSQFYPIVCWENYVLIYSSFLVYCFNM